MTKRHWIVRGRVQGVGFRYSARRQAQRLGLGCTAWNRDDGALECEAEGDEASLDALEKWLHQGPPSARVESVERVV